MNKEKIKNIVYGLRDPRNDVYQYIGKSSVGMGRPLSHLGAPRDTKVGAWVAELQEMWLYPEIDIIEEVEDLNDLSEREKYWIRYYNGINPNLLNTQLVERILLGRTQEDEEEFQMLVSSFHKIPRILKKERIYRKFTQQQIADELQVSRSTISKIERGDDSVNFGIIERYLILLKGLEIISKVNHERVRNKV